VADETRIDEVRFTEAGRALVFYTDGPPPLPEVRLKHAKEFPSREVLRAFIEGEDLWGLAGRIQAALRPWLVVNPQLDDPRQAQYRTARFETVVGTEAP